VQELSESYVNVERVLFASRQHQEFTYFDVSVHREKYHKAAVSWNYPSYHQQPDKWQVTIHKFYDRVTIYMLKIISEVF